MKDYSLTIDGTPVGHVFGFEGPDDLPPATPRQVPQPKPPPFSFKATYVNQSALDALVQEQVEATKGALASLYEKCAEEWGVDPVRLSVGYSHGTQVICIDGQVAGHVRMSTRMEGGKLLMSLSVVPGLPLDWCCLRESGLG